jgi:hypothetical protein
MAAITVLAPSQSDIILVKLARELAMDIQPLETILKLYSIDDEAWEKLKLNGKFQNLLFSEAEAWNGALNTHERVKLKAASMLEEFLPELNNRLHDQDEALPAKIEGAKMVARIAGMGERSDVGGSGGERFTVTINLGEDSKLLTFEKQLPAKVIEHDPSE